MSDAQFTREQLFAMADRALALRRADRPTEPIGPARRNVARAILNDATAKAWLEVLDLREATRRASVAAVVRHLTKGDPTP